MRLVQLPEQRSPTTRGGHTIQLAGLREEDDAVPVPRSTFRELLIADDLRRSARRLDSFELSIRKEADGLRVRGPKWQEGSTSR